MGEQELRLANLGDAMENSRMSRRKLVKRSVLFGLSAPLAGSLLAACGDDEEEPAEESEPTTAAPSGQATEEPEVEAEPTAEPEAEATEEPEAEATDEPEAEAEETPAGDDEDTTVAEVAGDGVHGGALYATILGDLGTFDTQAVTQSVVGEVTWHMWEHLFTYDENISNTPELADTYEVSDDGLTHTITVREAMFHNGKAMTAEDVVASITRWRQIAGTAGDLEDISTSLEAIDDRTVEWVLTRPFGILTTVLSRQNSGCVIFPKEIMEKIGTEPLVDSEDFIGTGTYKFVEHLPDRHIRLERFEDYVTRMEPSSGYAGYKNQYVDEIYFIPITDQAASAAGLRAGDYHYVADPLSTQFEPLDGDENVKVEILDGPTWGCFTINFEEGLVSGVDTPGHLIRQAMLACLDMELVAQGAYGEGWYRLHPSLAFAGSAWETDAGIELYNQANPERAKELLAEAGYNNEPIIWMADRESQAHYDTTVLAVQQLEDAGFNMELQIYDWATIGERRLDPSLYNLMTTEHTFRADPFQLSGIGSEETYGFWGSPAIDELRKQFTTEHEFDVRYGIWEEIQMLAYTEVPKMKVADHKGFVAMSAKLHGWDPLVQIKTKHWNHWLEEAE